MSTELTISIPDAGSLGPKMKVLTVLQRKFVLAWFHFGDKYMAARAAGYSMDVNQNANSAQVYQVWHNPRVQEAIQEFAHISIMNGLLPASFKALDEILKDPDHKARHKVAEMVLNRAGFHALSEHKVVVENTDDRAATVRLMAQLALAQGLDPRKVLAGLADVTEADYEMIETQTGREGLEDIL